MTGPELRWLKLPISKNKNKNGKALHIHALGNSTGYVRLATLPKMCKWAGQRHASKASALWHGIHAEETVPAHCAAPARRYRQLAIWRRMTKAYHTKWPVLVVSFWFHVTFHRPRVIKTSTQNMSRRAKVAFLSYRRILKLVSQHLKKPKRRLSVRVCFPSSSEYDTQPVQFGRGASIILVNRRSWGCLNSLGLP